MTDQTIFIGNIALISIFQIYIMIRSLVNKKFGKFFGDLLVYGAIIAFLIYEYFNLRILNFIITCSIVTVLGHSFVGSYLEIYYKSKTYDRYLHLFGSFSFSLLAFSIINQIDPLVYKDWIYPSLFVMTLGVTIGAFFEIIEFIHDSFFPRKIKCQHGLADTDFDLIFNIIGSVIAAILSRYIFL